MIQKNVKVVLQIRLKGNFFWMNNFFNFANSTVKIISMRMNIILSEPKKEIDKKVSKLKKRESL